MSELERLIQELCPNGVEYKTIEECCNVSAGGDVPKDRFSQIQTDEFSIPIISNGVGENAVYGYTDIAKITLPTVTVAARGTIGYAEYRDYPYFPIIRLLSITPKDNVFLDTKFLYYSLENRTYKVPITGIPQLTAPTIKKEKLPVPPLEVQREIVRILDNFKELTVELTAELTARKKQYDYYLELIINSAKGNVEETTMGKVLTFLNGRAYKQPELLAEGKYPVLRVGNFYTNNSWYYSDLELDEDKYCDNGDLLYSWAATLGPKIWDGEKCIFHYHIWKILFDEEKIDKQYLYYYLQYDLAQIASSTTKSTMIHVSMGSMKERPILIPSIDEQKRIADLISRFDALCNNIKEGLPAEIEARQKQYEYYREKLLTFKESSV